MAGGSVFKVRAQQRECHIMVNEEIYTFLKQKHKESCGTRWGAEE